MPLTKQTDRNGARRIQANCTRCGRTSWVDLMHTIWDRKTQTNSHECMNLDACVKRANRLAR